MRRVDKRGDLTRHICADCGGPIEGVVVRVLENGVARFYHGQRCEKRLPDAPLRGKTFPWTKETLRA